MVHRMLRESHALKIERTVPAIERWLRESREDALESLWRAADEIRRQNVGEEVHLRGLIEISNHCVRRCAYCGLGADHQELERYRMTEEEILECASLAVRLGYGTVVMQSGEDYGIRTSWMSDIVHRIKETTPLAVTLSLGERPDEDLQAWKDAGANRYLLRFETSDRELYDIIHPPLPGRISDRFAQLRRMRAMGYEIGSGVMVGIPGQTYANLASDILLFQDMDLDMIGVGPYLCHPDTPLGRRENIRTIPEQDQVPNTELMTYKVLSLTRMVCPQSNIPSTTALATVNKEFGRELGLMRGANIVMPNLTPVKYRPLYEIYPAKACIRETSEQCFGCLSGRIEKIGRTVGKGQGGRRK